MTPEYDLAVVRKLLAAAFNASGVSTLAFDLFHDEVYGNFGPGMNREDMIKAVVDYAIQSGQIHDVVEYVKNKVPYQYGRFAQDLIKR